MVIGPRASRPQMERPQLVTELEHEHEHTSTSTSTSTNEHEHEHEHESLGHQRPQTGRAFRVEHHT